MRATSICTTPPAIELFGPLSFPVYRGFPELIHVVSFAEVSRALPCALPRVSASWPEHMLLAITPLDRSWTVPGHSTEFTRWALPLRMAHAITIHKSQRMTITFIINDPEEAEGHVGILFTALSRCPQLANLAFNKPTDESRLKAVRKSKALARRKEWEAGHKRRCQDFPSFLCARAQVRETAAAVARLFRNGGFAELLRSASP